MTTAYVLSGGGSLGAVQAGMLQALAARGIRLSKQVADWLCRSWRPRATVS
jgi:hypothetical protein